MSVFLGLLCNNLHSDLTFTEATFEDGERNTESNISKNEHIQIMWSK